MTDTSRMLRQQIRLDVVICTYNNAALLAKTLECLATQKVCDSLEWRVLIVDNASTDATAAVVDAFRNDGRIHSIERVFEAEQGLVHARIRGVRETSAQWIAFIDDDCLLADEWLANAAKFIAIHPQCGAFGGIVRLKFEADPPPYVRRYGYSFAEQEHGEEEQLRDWLVGAGMVLNRSALLSSGWMEKQYLCDRQGNTLLSGGDMEIVLRIRSMGYELWYTPRCVIQHYIPAKRTNPAYLTRINQGLGVSQTWCDLLVSQASYRAFISRTLAAIGKGLGKAIRQFVGIFLLKRSWSDVRITLAFAKGRVTGLLQVLRTPPASRREMLGCARYRRPSAPHVALLHWGDLIEDFLGEINVSLQQFREKMTGGWMFGYVRALQTAGVKTTLICVSAQVRTVEWWIHQPTGADICVLPASRQYRWLASRGISSAIWKNDALSGHGHIRRQITRLLQDLLPYLATPIGVLRREIGQRQIHAIVCQEYEHARFDLSILAGILSNIPVYATFQGGDTQFSRLEKFFRRTTVRKSAGLIIGPSREIDRVRAGYGLPERRIARIFNPLDISMWYPEDRREARQKLQLPDLAFLVIWHGRIDMWRKGLDTLIEAWGWLMKSRPLLDGYLVLIGDGGDAQALSQTIEAKAVPHIIWHREYVLDRSLMRSYLSSGDVYAFTSRHEGFPVAPLEAMACGLPVVATDCVGVRDILSDDSDGGLIIPVNDAMGLAEKLGVLLDDHKLRQEMSMQARERIATNFSLSAVGNQLRDFLTVQHQSS